MKSTSPKPPSHCVSERHKRSHAGNVSGSTMTLLPVVVKPLIDSKRASVKLSEQGAKR